MTIVFSLLWHVSNVAAFENHSPTPNFIILTLKKKRISNIFLKGIFGYLSRALLKVGLKYCLIYLKDISLSVGEAGQQALRALTKLCNFLLSGQLPSEICHLLLWCVLMHPS
jgi:hypothetical protein